MFAAWDSAANGAAMPWALELYFFCKNYNALPRAGGILDQDSFELMAMDRAAYAYHLYKKDMKHYTADDQRLKYCFDILTWIRSKPAAFIRKKLNFGFPGILDENDTINTAVAEKHGLLMVVSDLRGFFNA